MNQMGVTCMEILKFLKYTYICVRNTVWIGDAHYVTFMGYKAVLCDYEQKFDIYIL